MAYSEECKKKQLKRHVPRLRGWRRIEHARTASGYSNNISVDLVEEVANVVCYGSQ